MDYNDVLNQAIYDAEIEDRFLETLDIELERIWKLKLIEQWKLIREYKQYIDYCERQTNDWIYRQIELDDQWQIDWKAQWKANNSQEYVIIDDVWESNWGLAIYTRYEYRKAKLIE
jgi:hypothetical protein